MASLSTVYGTSIILASLAGIGSAFAGNKFYKIGGVETETLEEEPLAEESEPLAEESEPLAEERIPTEGSLPQEITPLAEESEPLAEESEPLAEESEPLAEEAVQQGGAAGQCRTGYLSRDKFGNTPLFTSSAVAQQSQKYQTFQASADNLKMKYDEISVKLDGISNRRKMIEENLKVEDGKKKSLSEELSSKEFIRRSKVEQANAPGASVFLKDLAEDAKRDVEQTYKTFKQQSQTVDGMRQELETLQANEQSLNFQLKSLGAKKDEAVANADKVLREEEQTEREKVDTEQSRLGLMEKFVLSETAIITAYPKVKSAIVNSDKLIQDFSSQLLKFYKLDPEDKQKFFNDVFLPIQNKFIETSEIFNADLQTFSSTTKIAIDKSYTEILNIEKNKLFKNVYSQQAPLLRELLIKTFKIDDVSNTISSLKSELETISAKISKSLSSEKSIIDEIITEIRGDIGQTPNKPEKNASQEERDKYLDAKKKYDEDFAEIKTIKSNYSKKEYTVQDLIKLVSGQDDKRLEFKLAYQKIQTNRLKQQELSFQQKLVNKEDDLQTIKDEYSELEKDLNDIGFLMTPEESKKKIEEEKIKNSIVVNRIRDLIIRYNRLVRIIEAAVDMKKYFDKYGEILNAFQQTFNVEKTILPTFENEDEIYERSIKYSNETEKLYKLFDEMINVKYKSYINNRSRVFKSEFDKAIEIINQERDKQLKNLNDLEPRIESLSSQLEKFQKSLNLENIPNYTIEQTELMIDIYNEINSKKQLEEFIKKPQSSKEEVDSAKQSVKIIDHYLKSSNEFLQQIFPNLTTDKIYEIVDKFNRENEKEQKKYDNILRVRDAVEIVKNNFTVKKSIVNTGLQYIDNFLENIDEQDFKTPFTVKAKEVGKKGIEVGEKSLKLLDDSYYVYLRPRLQPILANLQSKIRYVGSQSAKYSSESGRRFLDTLKTTSASISNLFKKTSPQDTPAPTPPSESVPQGSTPANIDVQPPVTTIEQGAKAIEEMKIPARDVVDAMIGDINDTLGLHQTLTAFINNFNLKYDKYRINKTQENKIQLDDSKDKVFKYATEILKFIEENKDELGSLYKTKQKQVLLRTKFVRDKYPTQGGSYTRRVIPQSRRTRRQY